jgi:hypothetical protein
MRQTLRSGLNQFEILEEDDRVLTFRDLATAVDFLRRFRNDPAQMSILRKIAADNSYSAHRATTDEILKQVASLLVSGRFKILRSVQVKQSGLQATPQETEGAQKGVAPRVTNSSWIEINLRDQKGQPVAGAAYRIKLPDGSTREGNLDSFGHAEYTGISPGNCEVSFPALEDEDWEWQTSTN